MSGRAAAGVAASRGAERAREVRDGVRPGKRRLARRERRSVGPRVALERIARRDSRQRVIAGRRRRGVARARCLYLRAKRGDRVDGPLGRRVLRRLQVGVRLVVERVQLFRDRVVFPCGRRRRQVGLDRILPKADARERVGRHVERVRRVRRDLRVAPRRVERARRERRHVEAVNDVVREPGMLGLALELALEDAGGFQLVRVRLVGRQRRLVERQRIEDTRLDIVVVLRRERLHRFFVRDRPRALIDGCRVAEEETDRAHVGLLPIGAGAARVRCRRSRPGRPSAPAVNGNRRTDSPTSSSRCPSAPSRSAGRS